MTATIVVVELQERSDYAELAAKMQREIDQLRARVKDQRQQLVADDNKLNATCVALSDKVCSSHTTTHRKVTNIVLTSPGTTDSGREHLPFCQCRVSPIAKSLSK